MGIYREIEERKEKEKEEVIKLLREQIGVEGELVSLYEKAEADIRTTPVKQLLHLIQLDSRKHIDICQTAIEILQGEEMLNEERAELIEGLKNHIELEKGSIQRANSILDNVWIMKIKPFGNFSLN